MVVRMEAVHAAEAEWRGLLDDEQSIEWVRGFDPHQVRYVRQLLRQTEPAARGRPRCARFPGWRVVGWANLRPRARSVGGCFTRRVFFLRRHDPYVPGPVEAVDPLTIAPRVPGLVTARMLRPARRE
jgi:hypothetical protein